MSLVLEGTLADIRLGDLLRLIAREQRSGELRVTVDGVAFHFALHEGSLVRASIGDDNQSVEVQPTLLALIRFRRGEFRLAPGDGEPGEDESGGVHAEQLASIGDMELVGLRERFDGAGGEASYPRRDAFPTPKQMEALDPHARAVFGLVDGDRNLEEIILRSQFDPLHVMNALDHLVEQRMVKLQLDPDDASEGAGGASAPGGLIGRLGDLAAAALPLLLLLGWLAFFGPMAAPEGKPFEIRRDPLASARAAFDVEQLRAAVEAHRFAEGRWPARLSELVARGYVSDDALTDARGRPYYYAAREDGFVLLAPER